MSEHENGVVVNAEEIGVVVTTEEIHIIHIKGIEVLRTNYNGERLNKLNSTLQDIFFGDIYDDVRKSISNYEYAARKLNTETALVLTPTKAKSEDLIQFHINAAKHIAVKMQHKDIFWKNILKLSEAALTQAFATCSATSETTVKQYILQHQMQFMNNG